jgi:kynurenine formamidase
LIQLAVLLALGGSAGLGCGGGGGGDQTGGSDQTGGGSERTSGVGRDASLAFLDESRVIDLSHPFDERTIYWPTARRFSIERVAYGPSEGGYWYAANNYCAAEHGGTHMDSPIHFAEGGWTTEQVPLARCIGPACVIDATEACRRDPDYRLQVRDVQVWEAQHGALPAGAIVLMRAGWSDRWGDPKQVFNTETPEDTRTLHFPGFSAEVARFLVEERRIDAIGIDTPSLDHGPSADFQAHQIFGRANIPGFENVANLDQLPPAGATFIALPMKITGGSGGPARIIAILPEP